MKLHIFSLQGASGEIIKLTFDNIEQETIDYLNTEYSDFKHLSHDSIDVGTIKDLKPKTEKIESAKKLLSENGFYTGNLWSVEDVKSKFECTDDEAYKILDEALKNDATMEQIWFAIDFHGQENFLEAKD